MRSLFEKTLPNTITSSVVIGGRGEFTVNYDDKVIFDKADKDRFPEDGEIVKLITEIIDA